MKKFLVTGLLTLSVTSLATPSYFSTSAADVVKILANPIFAKYGDYTIDNIRQGELGESQAYFVRLVKPFATGKDGLCLQFLGSKTLASQPHSCDKAE